MFGIRDGIHLSKEKVGDGSDGEECFRMNVGYGRYHPGGNSFTYKWKKIPCLVEFSEAGGISGHILANILSHLDNLKLYENDRENGIIPSLLVGVHGICFDLGFLKYICD